MALFGMFAVDDLARMAIKKLEEHKEIQAISETVAQEFKNTGIVFAADPGYTSACLNCADAKLHCIQNANNNKQACLVRAGSDTTYQSTCEALYLGETNGCRDSYNYCCIDNHCNC